MLRSPYPVFCMDRLLGSPEDLLVPVLGVEVNATCVSPAWISALANGMWRSTRRWKSLAGASPSRFGGTPTTDCDDIDPYAHHRPTPPRCDYALATKEGIGDENPRRQHWLRVIREWRGGGGSRKVSGRFSCLRSSSKNPASSSQVRTLTEAKCPRRPFVQAKVTRHRS
jgi:hypothetical protein